jgi:hypothetical protein
MTNETDDNAVMEVIEGFEEMWSEGFGHLVLRHLTAMHKLRDKRLWSELRDVPLVWEGKLREMQTF